MKIQSLLPSVALVLILIFTGLSFFWTYSVYRTYSSDVAGLTEQLNSISKNLTNITNAQPKNKFIVLAWHKQIPVFGLDQWINVSSYEVGYLYYYTEAGSNDAMLSIEFPGTPSNVENVFPGTLYSMLDVQIGAPRRGVFKFDVQAAELRIYLYAMSKTQYDWIKTSISLYLVA